MIIESETVVDYFRVNLKDIMPSFPGVSKRKTNCDIIAVRLNNFQSGSSTIISYVWDPTKQWINREQNDIRDGAGNWDSAQPNNFRGQQCPRIPGVFFYMDGELSPVDITTIVNDALSKDGGLSEEDVNNYINNM